MHAISSGVCMYLCDLILGWIFDHTKDTMKAHAFPHGHLITHLLLKNGVFILPSEVEEMPKFVLNIHSYYKSIAQLGIYSDTLGPLHAITPLPPHPTLTSQTSNLCPLIENELDSTISRISTQLISSLLSLFGFMNFSFYDGRLEKCKQ